MCHLAGRQVKSQAKLRMACLANAYFDINEVVVSHNYHDASVNFHIKQICLKRALSDDLETSYTTYNCQSNSCLSQISRKAHSNLSKDLKCAFLKIDSCCSDGTICNIVGQKAIQITKSKRAHSTFDVGVFENSVTDDRACLNNEYE